MPILVEVAGGREVRLDDGAAFRVGPFHVAAIQDWQEGDPIARSEDRRLTYFVLLTNERTGACAQALPVKGH